MASELKLEVGKYYRTRDGRKVGPAWRDAGTDSYPWKLSSFYGDHWHADDGKSCVESDRDIIAEWTDAPTGPVRTVTRKEIVPGVYGRIDIIGGPYKDGHVCLDLVDGDGDRDGSGIAYYLSAAEIRAAIATLTEIADALEEGQ